MNRKLFGRIKIRTKIIVPTILVLLFSNFISTYTAAYKMNNMAKEKSINELRRLSDAIFLDFRTAMNTGDSTVIKETEEKAKTDIDGLEDFVVYKGKKIIELFDPTLAYTTDQQALKVFQKHKEVVIDKYEGSNHKLRILRPMVAKQDCLYCHVNQQVGDVIGVFDLTFSLNKSDSIINGTILNLTTQAIIVMIFISLFMMWLIRAATQPIVYFQEGLEAFFKYMNKEEKDVKAIDTYSDDEIGDLVKAVNANIEKAVTGIELDENVINDAKDSCSRAAKGELSVRISTQANNPEINELKDTVNTLLDAFKYNIDRIIRVLTDYANDDYTSAINSKGSTIGEMKDVFNKIDQLGQTLSLLSKTNFQNGEKLHNDTLELQNLIETIKAISAEQSASLKEQKDELDIITNSVKNSTTKAISMAQLAQKVTTSANEGSKLATATTNEMNDIATYVSNINDSIVVIDQIALQTNILSLNAAVEASTAGEIGKGFAVVASEVRNLANKSAEAAKEIKAAVEVALEKANEGKDISDSMIKGFTHLNEDIKSTISLIEEVTDISKSQEDAIININQKINHIESRSFENSELANKAASISSITNKLAQTIVEDAKKKKF
jgi:methyl-accepting chemotaxis protein